MNDKTKDAGEEGGSALRKVIGLFVTDDSASEAGPEGASKPTPAPAVSVVQNGKTAVAGHVAQNADPALMGRLREAVAKSTETALRDFMAVVEALAEDVTDERSRYRAALRVAGKQGITLARIIRAFEDRLRLLQREKQQFEAAMETRFKEAVGGRQEDLERVNAEVAELRERLTGLESRAGELTAAIEAEQQKIEQVSTSFDAAYAVVASEIESEREKIGAHLGQ